MMRKATGHTRLLLGGCALLVCLLCVGCGNKPTPPPAAYMGPTLRADELGIRDTACPQTGYVIIEQAHSVGRFPGALAVARLVCDEADGTGDAPISQWAIDSIREEYAIYWNSLFNTVRAVREVVMLDPLSLERPIVDIGRISASGRLMKADLCLVYAPASAEPDHAALVGIMTDTQTGDTVAMVRADAGPEDFTEPTPDQLEEDLRHQDVNYIVARKLESQVKECVFELIARDERRTTTQPSPYHAATSDHAFQPVIVMPNRPSGW